MDDCGLEIIGLILKMKACVCFVIYIWLLWPLDEKMFKTRGWVIVKRKCTKPYGRVAMQMHTIGQNVNHNAKMETNVNHGATNSYKAWLVVTQGERLINSREK